MTSVSKGSEFAGLYVDTYLESLSSAAEDADTSEEAAKYNAARAALLKALNDADSLLA